MTDSDTSCESVEDASEDLWPIYCELCAEGLNTVDGIILILRNACIIDGSVRSETMVRELFGCVKDKNNIEYEPFQIVVVKLATKLELLKISWRLKKAERQLKKAEREINRAIRSTSREIKKSLECNRILKYQYSRTTKKER